MTEIDHDDVSNEKVSEILISSEVLVVGFRF